MLAVFVTLDVVDVTLVLADIAGEEKVKVVFAPAVTAFSMLFDGVATFETWIDGENNCLATALGLFPTGVAPAELAIVADKGGAVVVGVARTGGVPHALVVG